MDVSSYMRKVSGNSAGGQFSERQLTRYNPLIYRDFTWVSFAVVKGQNKK